MINVYIFYLFSTPGAATTTSSMANDTTAKTTNSTTYDYRKRYEHEIIQHENVIVADEPTVNANNMLPLLSNMSNDHNEQQQQVLATKTKSSHISFDKLIELLNSESKRICELNNATKSTDVAMRLLRLCGGGEQGINNGTTGWGSPPTAPSVAAGKFPFIKTSKRSKHTRTQAIVICRNSNR